MKITVFRRPTAGLELMNSLVPQKATPMPLIHQRTLSVRARTQPVRVTHDLGTLGHSPNPSEQGVAVRPSSSPDRPVRTPGAVHILSHPRPFLPMAEARGFSGGVR